jgi:hypothetical protein
MTPLRRFALALLAFTVNVHAAGEWNPETNYPSLKPADAIRTIEVPRGHKLVCIASEPMVEEPKGVSPHN